MAGGQYHDNTTKDPFYKVGYNILCLRKGHSETALDLGDAIGVGKSVISEYETGSRGKVPPRNVLMNIAKHYGVTVDDLIEGDFSEFDLGNYDGITFQALKKAKECPLFEGVELGGASEKDRTTADSMADLMKALSHIK